MSLTALQVTATDIATLEQGVQFMQSLAANQTAVAAAIDTTGSTQSVFTYPASLLGLTTPSLAQIAMADAQAADKRLASFTDGGRRAPSPQATVSDHRIRPRVLSRRDRSHHRRQCRRSLVWRGRAEVGQAKLSRAWSNARPAFCF
jgi:hypothetical protein